MWKKKYYRTTYQMRRYLRLPRALDNAVGRRDQGICRKCGLDTIKLHFALKYVFGKCENGERWVWWPLEFWQFKRAVGPAAARFPRRLYDIDHILAVDDGGADEMENLQTLCVPCHNLKSAEDAKRKKLKKQKSRSGEREAAV